MDESQQNKVDPEEFLYGPSLINNLRKLLDDVSTSNQMAETTKKEETVEKNFTTPEVNEEDFIITLPPDELSKSKRHSKVSYTKPIPVNISPSELSFINQIDCDQETRIRMRNEREKIANNFRSLGNFEYRNNEYKKAIIHYTKGLEAVTDTPVLYCNRALCYAKLRDYNRALFDIEFVLNRLDPSCLNAWLYRAACYMRLDEQAKSQDSIRFARERNCSKQEIINDFILRMQAEF